MSIFSSSVMAALVGLLCSISLPVSVVLAAPPAERTVTINIDAQPMEQALNDFAEQAGLQLLVRADAVARDITAPRLVGTYTAQDALQQLLANTALAFKFIDARTVAIRAAQPGSGAGSEETSAVRIAQPALRLAWKETTTATEDVQDGSRAETDAEQGIRGIPEMLVKGRRSANTDIRRTEDDVQPYVVFDAETINRSMAPNLEDFLKSRLPMNAVVGTNSQQADLPGNVSSIDLRGLGTDETLILVNGRRLPGVSYLNRGGAIGQADINGIPISAVERIEVLPSTASGIYGGGATGGVVNIILKSDFNTFEAGVTYDNTFDTDSGTRRLDLTGGFNLFVGMTNVLLTGSYSDGNGLAVGDRDFVNRGYKLYVKNTENDLTSGSTPLLGSTANINLRSGDTQLRLKDPNGGPSIPLGYRITHVPIGYEGVQSDGGAALLANAGSYNIELPRDVQGLAAGIVNNPTVTSLGANVRHQFGERLEGFLDLSWSTNQGHVQSASDTISYRLDPEDQGNPFDNRIRVTFPTPGLSIDKVFESENRVANAGLIARLPREWIGQAELSWSRSRTEGLDTSPFVNDLVLDPAVRAGTVDVFRDLNLFTPDFASGGYLLDSPNYLAGPFINTQTGATLRLAGPVYQLPGGAVVLSAFYEHREEEADEGSTQTASLEFDPDTFEQYYGNTILYYADRSREVDSLSLELNAPFISSGNARRFVHALEGQISVRYDDYQINGVETGAAILDVGDPFPDLDRRTASLSSSDYTLGFRYAPSEDIAFRASYGTGFLPPSVAQITPSMRVGNLFATDPKRGGLFSSTPNVTQISGGNPDLDPEESTSLSIGVVLTPRIVPGLRLSLDYTAIDKTDEISFVSSATLLANEDLAPGRVTRAELTQEDIDANYTGGVITAIDTSSINFARTSVRSFDVQIDYLFDTTHGSLRAYALASYLSDYITQFQPGAPLIDNAGHSTRLQWRGNAGLVFERDAWSLDWNMQYFDSYLFYPATLPAASIPFYIAEQGSDTIPRQIYHDLVGRLRLSDLVGLSSGIFANTDVQIGIRNIFNTSPPTLATFVPSGGYSFFGDPRLRRYSISVRKRF